MDNKSSTKILYFAGGILTAVGTGILAFLAILYRNYEVLEKGQLLSYTRGKIYKIRFFDSITLFLEPEHSLRSDDLVCFFLLGCAFISLTYAFLLARQPGGIKKPFWMYVTLVLGMVFLTIDEFYGVHESIGHNLQFLASLPLIKRPDDVIILLYSIPVTLFAYIFFRQLSISRKAFKTVILAMVFFALAALSDALSIPFEELFEMGSAGSLLASLIILGSAHLDEHKREAREKSGFPQV
jgi:hypothetical protein